MKKIFQGFLLILLCLSYASIYAQDKGVIEYNQMIIKNISTFDIAYLQVYCDRKLIDIKKFSYLNEIHTFENLNTQNAQTEHFEYNKNGLLQKYSISVDDGLIEDFFNYDNREIEIYLFGKKHINKPFIYDSNYGIFIGTHVFNFSKTDSKVLLTIKYYFNESTKLLTFLFTPFDGEYTSSEQIKNETIYYKDYIPIAKVEENNFNLKLFSSDNNSFNLEMVFLIGNKNMNNFQIDIKKQ